MPYSSRRFHSGKFGEVYNGHSMYAFKDRKVCYSTQPNILGRDLKVMIPTPYFLRQKAHDYNTQPNDLGRDPMLQHTT